MIRIQFLPEAEISSSSPSHPDQLWGPPSLLYDGIVGSFPRSKVAGV